MIFIIVAVLKPFEFLNVRFFHGAFTGGRTLVCRCPGMSPIAAAPGGGVADSAGAGEPNVNQPEWGYGPSALHWAFFSSPVTAAKQMLGHEVYNGIQWSFTQRHGRRTLFSLFTAQNTE